VTKDNSDRVDTDTGDPGPDLEPSDVVKCRECGGMVRRVNTQHLGSDRCRFTQPKKVRSGEGIREERSDLLRPDHPETVEEYKDKHPDAPIVSPRQKEMLAEANREERVDERRREMLKRRWRGEAMTDIVESLADRYEVSESMVWNDWQARGDWISRVFGLDDAEAVVVESLAQKQDVRERLLRVARQAEDKDDANEAIRALKAVDRNIDDTIEHQQKLGNVDKAASEHKVHVDGGVEHDHDHELSPGEQLGEETLEQLDGLTGGEGEEIVEAEFEVVNEDDEEGGGGEGEDGEGNAG
jgi:hypothetical protein